MTFEIDFKEMKNRLEEFDKRTLDERTERIVALGGVGISLVDRFVPNLMGEYHREAQASYINGIFRGCIFNCAAVLDQIIRHEYIANASNPTNRLLEIEKDTLGSMISKHIKDIPSLKPLEREFSWMNQARNTISVHPTCIIDPYIDEKTTNMQKADYIKKIISLLDEPDQKQILARELRESDRTIYLKDVLANPTTEDAYLYLLWDEHNQLVEPVALKSYRILVKVLTNLYPAKY